MVRSGLVVDDLKFQRQSNDKALRPWALWWQNYGYKGTSNYTTKILQDLHGIWMLDPSALGYHE